MSDRREGGAPPPPQLPLFHPQQPRAAPPTPPPPQQQQQHQHRPPQQSPQQQRGQQQQQRQQPVFSLGGGSSSFVNPVTQYSMVGVDGMPKVTVGRGRGVPRQASPIVLQTQSPSSSYHIDEHNRRVIEHQKQQLMAVLMRTGAHGNAAAMNFQFPFPFRQHPQAPSLSSQSQQRQGMVPSPQAPPEPVVQLDSDGAVCKVADAKDFSDEDLSNEEGDFDEESGEEDSDGEDEDLDAQETMTEEDRQAMQLQRELLSRAARELQSGTGAAQGCDSLAEDMEVDQDLDLSDIPPDEWLHLADLPEDRGTAAGEERNLQRRLLFLSETLRYSKALYADKVAKVPPKFGVTYADGTVRLKLSRKFGEMGSNSTTDNPLLYKKRQRAFMRGRVDLQDLQHERRKKLALETLSHEVHAPSGPLAASAAMSSEKRGLEDPAAGTLGDPDSVDSSSDESSSDTETLVLPPVEQVEEELRPSLSFRSQLELWQECVEQLRSFQGDLDSGEDLQSEDEDGEDSAGEDVDEDAIGEGNPTTRRSKRPIRVLDSDFWEDGVRGHVLDVASRKAVAPANSGDKISSTQKQKPSQALEILVPNQRVLWKNPPISMTEASMQKQLKFPSVAELKQRMSSVSSSSSSRDTRSAVDDVDIMDLWMQEDSVGQNRFYFNEFGQQIDLADFTQRAESFMSRVRALEKIPRHQRLQLRRELPPDHPLFPLVQRQRQGVSGMQGGQHLHPQQQMMMMYQQELMLQQYPPYPGVPPEDMHWVANQGMMPAMGMDAGAMMPPPPPGFMALQGGMDPFAFLQMQREFQRQQSMAQGPQLAFQRREALARGEFVPDLPDQSGQFGRGRGRNRICTDTMAGLQAQVSGSGIVKDVGLIHHNDHKPVARKLVDPFYRCYYEDEQLRLLHRPKPIFNLDVGKKYTLHWHGMARRLHPCLRALYYQKLARENPGFRIPQYFADVEDLSETHHECSVLHSHLVGLEYREEFPVLLNNLGMAMRIVNYYKKLSPDDSHVPRVRDGLTVVLEKDDETPLLAPTEPGTMVTSAECALFRAEMFSCPREPRPDPSLAVTRRSKEESNNSGQEPTDAAPSSSSSSSSSSTSRQQPVVDEQGYHYFLLVRRVDTDPVEQLEVGDNFYIRPVPSLFTVARLQPRKEVPAPASHSEIRLTRDRLTSYIYRHFLNQNMHGIPYFLHAADIINTFPSMTENQIRKRLHDICTLRRPGADYELYTDKRPFWVPKEGEPFPSVNFIEETCTPERVCMYESMLAGNRRREDKKVNRFMSMAAFAVSQAMSLDRKPDILRTIKFIEEVGRRDPWNTSANFLAAVRGQGTVGVADADVQDDEEDEWLNQYKKAGTKADRSAGGNAAGPRTAAEVLSERFRQESETLRNASLKLMEDHERRRRKLRLASKDPDAEGDEDSMQVDDVKGGADGEDSDEGEALGDKDILARDQMIDDLADWLDNEEDGDAPAGEEEHELERREYEKFMARQKALAQAVEQQELQSSGNTVEKRTIIVRRYNKPEREGSDILVRVQKVYTDPAMVARFLANRKRRKAFMIGGALRNISSEQVALFKGKRERRRLLDQLRRFKQNMLLQREEGGVIRAVSRELTMGGTSSSVRCSACHQIGHMASNLLCPMYGKLRVDNEGASSVTNGGRKLKLSKKLLSSKLEAESVEEVAAQESKLAPAGEKRPAEQQERPPTPPRRRDPKMDVRDLNQKIILPVLKSLKEIDSEGTMSTSKEVLFDLPKYLDIIKKPISLRSIEMKIAENEYYTFEEFVEDVRLLFSNSRTYWSSEEVEIRDLELVETMNNIEMELERFIEEGLFLEESFSQSAPAKESRISLSLASSSSGTTSSTPAVSMDADPPFLGLLGQTEETDESWKNT